jgi:hypothetical protein
MESDREYAEMCLFLPSFPPFEKASIPHNVLICPQIKYRFSATIFLKVPGRVLALQRRFNTASVQHR